MSNPLDRLRAVKQKAELTDADRKSYQIFIARMRDNGWTDADVDKYSTDVKVLMTGSESSGLALYAPGYYPSIQAARDSAVECWRKYQ